MDNGDQKPLLERCELKVVEGHLEAVCDTKDDQHELGAVLEEEAILRVKPKVAPEEEVTF